MDLRAAGESDDMPANGNPAPAAGENLYDDSADANSAPAADSKEDEGGETALVPKSLCPGMRPGDELVLKIDKVLEDQYQVSYKPKGGNSEESGESEMPKGDAEMQDMMS